MVSRASAWLLLVALALGSAPAAADEYEVSSADRETARGHMDRGRDLYADGNFGDALVAFEKADAIMNVTSTGLWVGKALIKVGKLIEARDKLIAVREMPKEDNESTVLAGARGEADVLQLEIADAIPELSISMKGLPPDAEVRITVDDEVIEPSTLVLPRKINPGRHVIRASSPGYIALEVGVDLAERAREQLELTFVAIQAKPEPEPVEVAPEPGPNIPMWICFGVAGAGVVVGAITGGVSLAKANAAREGCNGDDCATGQGDPDAKSSSLTLAHVSTTAFIVGGAAAAAGLVLLLVDETSAPESALYPFVGPGFAGVTGRF